MGYDVDLVDETGECCHLDEPQTEGGTYCIGGRTETTMSITYNYSFFYYHFLDDEEGLRWLYGKKAKDCIPKLERAVEILGKDRYKKYTTHPLDVIFGQAEKEEYTIDYWAATPGNAGYALSILLEWAKQFPDATFQGD